MKEENMKTSLVEIFSKVDELMEVGTYWILKKCDFLCFAALGIAITLLHYLTVFPYTLYCMYDVYLNDHLAGSMTFCIFCMQLGLLTTFPSLLLNNFKEIFENSRIAISIYNTC